MKTTQDWLESYCPVGISANELADMITNAGLEVEHLAPSPNGKQVLTIEVTSNRVDALGNLGLARELAALKQVTLELPKVHEASSTGAARVPVTIDSDALALCPHYTAHLIKGVKIGPSPAWLRDRLEAIGCASINNIVDITNYVMFECSQPLHAFDYDKLRGGLIRVRRAQPGEVFHAINHRDYKLQPDDLVIADAEGPVALAGVMGGAESEISSRTVNVLLESAYFEPAGVKATGRRMDAQHSDNLDSDSRYRFERGVDPAGAMWAAKRAVALILELAGGEVAAPVSEAGGAPAAWLRELTLTSKALARTLGADVPMEHVAKRLAGLGLEILTSSADAVSVRVPSFRRDLEREIDLVEEIARLEGLNSFEARLSVPVASSRADSLREDTRKLRQLLLGMGFDEALTDTFVPAQECYLWSPWSEASGATRLDARAPVNVQRPAIRGSILASLVAAYALNARQGQRDARLFECSTVTIASGTATPADLLLAALVSPDFDTAKGAVNALFARLHLHGVEWKALDATPLSLKGEAAEALVNGQRVAIVGRFAPAAQKALDVPDRPGFAELLLPRFTAARTRVPLMQALPRFPQVERDLAVVVDENVTWATIEACAKELGGADLRSTRFFDEFRGKQIPAGKKSLAFSLVFRNDERTLVSDEVDASVGAVVEALKSRHGAELRG